MAKFPGVTVNDYVLSSLYSSAPVIRPPSQRVKMEIDKIKKTLKNVQTDEEIRDIEKQLEEISNIVDEEMESNVSIGKTTTDSAQLNEVIDMSNRKSGNLPSKTWQSYGKNGRRNKRD